MAYVKHGGRARTRRVRRWGAPMGYVEDQIDNLPYPMPGVTPSVWPERCRHRNAPARPGKPSCPPRPRVGT